MIEKSLTVILFMYSLSIGFLGFQYIIGDVFHITMTNYNGEELSGDFITSWMDLTTFNTQTGLIVNGTYTPENGTTFYNRVETFTTAAAAVAWNLIQLLSGTYIFNLILFLGVPWPIVAGFVILYSLLLARAIIGYVRGI